MSKTPTTPEKIKATPVIEKSFTRFKLLQRIEHFVFLLSFSLLGFTGLPQKYADTPLGQGLLMMWGGIETTRLIHHVSAFVMMIVSVYHVNEVLYRILVDRTSWTMLPVMDDIKHLFQDIQYYLGLRNRKAYYGRYNYAEKMEYLAVIWGTLIMGLTGFMMWNPITTAKLLPGEVIPASKAAHGGEAVLAVAAIIIWHFYHVHLRHFNKSMFTGKLTRAEMEHEHPAELEEIDTGTNQKPPTPLEKRKRLMVFYPIAAVITIISILGVSAFISVEKTAITTIPQGETVAIFVPITPTPRPTLTPNPTPDPNRPVGSETWEGKYQALLRNRCDNCHGITSVGGLSLETYQSALKGGNSGPAIIPGDPDNSLLVQIQSRGAHPGQLTIDELNQVIAWIEAGAPEK
jgi:cytochrome b subunit of formate dehydrogenase